MKRAFSAINAVMLVVILALDAPTAEVTSQFILSRFESGAGKEMYLAVNNSIVTAANIRLCFGEDKKFTVVYRGESKRCEGETLYFQRVLPGDNLLIVIE